MIEPSAWRALILRYLGEFASAEYQKRIWALGSGPDVSSFEEAYCMFFDNCMAGDELSKKWNSIGITEVQWKSIDNFSKILEQFGRNVPENSDTYCIINHPDWPAIRCAANNALKKFKNICDGPK